MSSYATYCQDQATDCRRRARLAVSPEIAAYYQGLERRWLSLAEHARGTGGALRDASGTVEASRPRFSSFDIRKDACASLKKLYQELSPHCVQPQAH